VPVAGSRARCRGWQVTANIVAVVAFVAAALLGQRREVLSADHRLDLVAFARRYIEAGGFRATVDLEENSPRVRPTAS
jgi:hypothetical protein